MVDNTFTYEKKKRLADKISKIKKKEDLVKIFEIIHNDNKNYTETQNGLFMLFNSLSDATYHKIDLYIRSITKKKTANTSENLSEQEYKSYVKNDFPEQKHFNPKLKYSNREKNIIKRQRYDKLIESEKNDTNIIYQKFDASSEPPELLEPPTSDKSSEAATSITPITLITPITPIKPTKKPTKKPTIKNKKNT